MRKITVISMITLDGVMQAPGGPEEDRSGGFEYGGCVAPFEDEISATVLGKLMQPSDLLLGRKTFEIWEDYWPKHEDIWQGVNDVTKYVLSTTKTDSSWSNSVFLQNIEEIKKLNSSGNSGIQVWGSSKLV